MHTRRAVKTAKAVEAVYKKITSLRMQYSRLVKALPSGSSSAAKTSHQKWLIGHNYSSFQF